MNLISVSKVGKSWLVYMLALSVIHARLWLETFQCVGGKVLIIDNELHKATLVNRIRKVAEAMGIEPYEYEDDLDIVALRGNLTDLHGLREVIEQSAGTYNMVIVDAWYRMLGNINESDNGAMTSLYNVADEYAATSGAAWTLVHHSSKGSQSDKRTTDVGSGAGAMSRAADTHLVLREHEDDGLMVLDGKVRSFAPIQPLALRWNFPLWRPDAFADPKLLKGRKSDGEQRQDERDQEGMEVIFDIVAEWNTEVDREPTPNRITEKSPYGTTRSRGLLSKLLHAERVTREPVKLRGQETHIYAPAEP
jgi:hypothetical protein